MVKSHTKKAGAKNARRGPKKTETDFVGTLDSDEEDNIEKSGSDHEGAEKSDDENGDMNPSFQFGFEDASAKFNGWDFEVGETETAKKSVDLDKILKQKGGLVNLVGVEKKDQESDDEVEDNEIEENDDQNAASDSDDEAVAGEEPETGDDDELALDGFGMGANDNKDQTEQVEEDNEEAEEESLEEEKLEVVSDKSDNENENEEDSAEALAEFYDSSNSQASTVGKFSGLQLSRPVMKALANLGYTKPSPIQASSIPIALMGKDIVAGAVTGSGKTAAYMIPIIERLLYKPSKTVATRVIVLAPTRELAIQVCDVGRKIASFIPTITFGLAVGGLNLRQQEQQLKSRPDIVIATPGRLIDHIRNSASFSIDSLEILVIDEADRMLDEGFQVELTEILSLIPKHKRQTMLFSATMNTKIQDLIQLSLQKPVRIMIDPPKTASNNLIQEFVRIRKRDHLKAALLYQLLRDSANAMSRIVVFVARKETAHRLRIVLGLLGLKVSELHGGLTQEQRLENVTDFKNLVVPVLVCTDLAARGLDIPKIELVVNYDMPKSYEIYLHRVGRTARAGRDGRSITFVGESTQDRNIIKDAIKSLNDSESLTKGKALSRSVDWKEVEELNKVVESKTDTIEEVIEEEKHAKEILSMEMELNKASNLIKHKNEIESRPKRTWFQTEQEKKGAMHNLTKHGKKINSKKRKAMEVKKENPGRPYKKTRADRLAPPKKVSSKKKSKK